MNLRENYTIDSSFSMLRAYALNDAIHDSKVILGMCFGKNKAATKKRSKVEDNYLQELSKDSISLPYLFGKAPTVALFTLRQIDKRIGVDFVGSDDLIKDIQGGKVAPNYLIAFRDEMSLLNKYSRVLGPKGLMPTPKQNTIVEEDTIVKSIETLKKRSFKLKVNKALMAQLPVGTLKMTDDQLVGNVSSILTHINNKLPGSFLKTNLKVVYVTVTQGPCAILKIR